MRTVFVTGATGFIGRNVAEALLSRGCETRCLVRSAERGADLQHAGARLVEGTLADVTAWRSALAGCDTVINAAGLVCARRHADLHEVNGRAVGPLADACAALETPPVLVHVSSLAAAGPCPAGRPARDEADPPRPISHYGRSKRAGEAELERRADRLPATLVQPGCVFGPHETKLAEMFKMIDVARLHLVMGFRQGPLSLIHSADLVSLILAAAERGERLPAAPAARPGQGTYHACDDREYPSHAELGRRIARAQGRSVLVFPLPLTLAYPGAFVIASFWSLLGQPSIVSPDKIREATAPSWAASAAKARTQLGFAPAATLDERLRETAHWLRSRRRRPDDSAPRGVAVP